MGYDFNDNLPIYKQVIDIIKLEIISNKILPGEKLLSIREYSEKFNVNPNTVQKALAQLEKDKIIFTERTNGKFITKDIDIVNKMKDHIVTEKVEKFLKNMFDIGFSIEEINNLINTNTSNKGGIPNE